nr:MAG TPA: hypothetical protein [Bacteriophage sp.]
MKPKKYEIANYIAMGDKTLNEIKRDFKAQTIITAILVILALIICFMSWDTAVKYEALKKDKQALEDITEMQRSMISDLEENCKDLYIEIENFKQGEYNYGI